MNSQNRIVVDLISERSRLYMIQMARFAGIFEFGFLGRWASPMLFLIRNENLIALVDKLGEGTIEDHVVEFLRTTGSIIRVWDLRENLMMTGFDLVDNPIDWIHANAVIVDDRDNTITISGRNQGFIKVDNSNQVKWIMSPHKG